MGRRPGSKTRLKPTEVTAKILKYFVGPFIEQFIYRENEEERVAGYRAFFNTSNRRLCFCKAKNSFKMPGLMWETVSLPAKLVDGTGRRHVKSGDPFVLRVDKGRPEIVEIEFDEQVFHLKAFQYEVIKDFVELIA